MRIPSTITFSLPLLTPPTQSLPRVYRGGQGIQGCLDPSQPISVFLAPNRQIPIIPGDLRGVSLFTYPEVGAVISMTPIVQMLRKAG